MCWLLWIGAAGAAPFPKVKYSDSEVGWFDQEPSAGQWRRDLNPKLLQLPGLSLKLHDVAV